MPRKTLFKPRPIVNVDSTENKAGAVTEACILEIEHQGKQKLQHFYITDLGFDQVLLGYLWLSTFNPQIDWGTEKVEGKLMLKTVANAWERWKELQHAALVAQVQLAPVTIDQIEVKDEEEREELTITEAVDNKDWGAIVSRTNFAQDWAQEAKEASPKQETVLPEEYDRHQIVFSKKAAKRFPPSRPEDHAIKLKPGAPAKINCKIYPLTKAELEATKKFLDDNLVLGFIERCNEGG